MQALDRRTVLVGASAILPATGLMKRGTGEGVTKSLKRTVTVKGVTIGKGTVVGAGSVVTKSLPPGVIAVGVPAQVIRKINQ